MEYLPVVMIRESVNSIPDCELPEGFSVRDFQEGDKATWVRIWQAAEPYLAIDAKTFDHEFGSDLPAMKKRGLFLVSPDGRDVGTVTSWYDKKYQGKPWGRIHWLAITPEFQGQGLARPLMQAAMKRFKRCGHKRAMLVTQTPRLAAIKTYLDFGFKPDLAFNEDAKRAWGLVREAIGTHPGLKGIRRPAKKKQR